MKIIYYYYVCVHNNNYYVHVYYILWVCVRVDLYVYMLRDEKPCIHATHFGFFLDLIRYHVLSLHVDSLLQHLIRYCHPSTDLSSIIRLTLMMLESSSVDPSHFIVYN